MGGKFLTYTQNCKQKATIGTVKSSFNISSCHKGVIPIKKQDQSLENVWLTS